MLKRVLNAELSLIRTPLFPKQFQNSSKRYAVTLGVGGNIGDVIRTLQKLVHYFLKSRQCDLIRTGPILKNPPFGYVHQDDFHNSVMIVKTDLQPRAFLQYVLEVERKFGRRRSFANAPRTLDIDMIFYENRKMDREDLKLPHPHWHERSSVVIPMAYMEGR